ncbi:hypothetical protein DJ010_08775 [Nocardioides silvaticus]|uniref:Uncharacterized protein n=1 Tax=Nocardioides silvaticus TaxID=2201891 RepID=A0A316TM45_9ACTN|nr:DUF5701 family protein [Nocardioides silvaticus]PWN03204.1 hypothetical protein DJ010_08775 [Nocardioides silvaticus]
MPLPSLTDQAHRLLDLGVHHLAGTTPDDVLGAAGRGGPDGLLVTAAPASALAPLLRLGDKEGFVVEDMTDVDDFRPTDAAAVPAAPYVVAGLDRGDAHLDRTPAETLPDLLAAGRSPLTLEEGLHWVLQDPDVLERNRCFMTIGSRLTKPDGAYDARTPALWISNGTGRDGKERKGAPKLGWCWWGNRHTWLGIASCGSRQARPAEDLP